MNSKIVIILACFLPCGKAEHTAYPSLPRVCGSTLQLAPSDALNLQHPRLLQRWGLFSAKILKTRRFRFCGAWHFPLRPLRLFTDRHFYWFSILRISEWSFSAFFLTKSRTFESMFWSFSRAVLNANRSSLHKEYMALSAGSTQRSIIWAP